MSRNQRVWEQANLAAMQKAKFQPFCEVRVRTSDDKRNWEEIRPIAQLDMNIEQVRIMFTSYHRLYGIPHGELRINEIGSLQGHYFTI